MPTQYKTFRVFISSTFADMREERRILQNEVFPKLEKHCESKGARFQAVDLRWGVTEASQLEQKTIDICLGEILRCQTISPKPNFLILLGDRYGWQPIPSKIPLLEMEEIIPMVSSDEKLLLDKWYKLDENAIPAEYVLQPREGEDIEYAKWEQTEKRLRENFRKVVTKLDFTIEQKNKYFCSATHLEILNGALNPPKDVDNPEKHVFTYSRKIKGLPNNNTAIDYLDFDGEMPDEYSKNQLDGLKEELKSKLKKNYSEYNAVWDNDKSIIEQPETFAEKVYNDLVSIIQPELETIESIDVLSYELSLQKEFKDKLNKHFRGRDEVLKRIQGYILDDKQNRPFVLLGKSGSGKSSVMAQSVQLAENNFSDAKIYYRFIGATAYSTRILNLLQSIYTQIAKDANIDIEKLKEEDNTIAQTGLYEYSKLLKKCLEEASVKFPIIIYLDALDQISDDTATKNLFWLPKVLPKFVKIIVSVLPKLNELLKDCCFEHLPVLSVNEATNILQSWFAGTNRKITLEQENYIFEKFQLSGLPLYLKLAYEISKEWKSYSFKYTLEDDVSGIINNLMENLENEHGKDLVQTLIAYMLSGRYQGLTEKELLEILVFDKDFWDNKYLPTTHPLHREEIKEATQMPIVVWSRLFYDLKPFLTERDADGISIITFFHRLFLNTLKKRYINYFSTYTNLSLYFTNNIQYNTLSNDLNSKRPFTEINYQNIKSKRIKEFIDLVSDYRFIRAMLFLNLYTTLINDLDEFTIENININENELIAILLTALKSSEVSIKKHPRLAFQYLFNYLKWEDSNLVKQVILKWKKFINNDDLVRFWLESLIKPDRAMSSFMQTIDKNIEYDLIEYSNDGNYLAAAHVNSVVVYDINSKTKLYDLKTPKLINGGFIDLCWTKSDRWICAIGEIEGYVVIWDFNTGENVFFERIHKHGKLIQLSNEVFKTHLFDHDVLTCGNDFFKLWHINEKGERFLTESYIDGERIIKQLQELNNEDTTIAGAVLCKFSNEESGIVLAYRNGIIIFLENGYIPIGHINTDLVIHGITSCESGQYIAFITDDYDQTESSIKSFSRIGNDHVFSLFDNLSGKHLGGSKMKGHLNKGQFDTSRNVFLISEKDNGFIGMYSVNPYKLIGYWKGPATGIDAVSLHKDKITISANNMIFSIDYNKSFKMKEDESIHNPIYKIVFDRKYNRIIYLNLSHYLATYYEGKISLRIFAKSINDEHLLLHEKDNHTITSFEVYDENILILGHRNAQLSLFNIKTKDKISSKTVGAKSIIDIKIDNINNLIALTTGSAFDKYVHNEESVSSLILIDKKSFDFVYSHNLGKIFWHYKFGNIISFGGKNNEYILASGIPVHLFKKINNNWELHELFKELVGYLTNISWSVFLEGFVVSFFINNKCGGLYLIYENSNTWNTKKNIFGYALTSMDLSSCGRYIAFSSVLNEIFIAEINKDSEIMVLFKYYIENVIRINSVCINIDSNLLSVGDSNGRMHLFYFNLRNTQNV
jgi:hypothetical protein